MLCSVVPPSKEFAKYLAVFLGFHIEAGDKTSKYANYSLQMLDKTMKYGQRQCKPNSLELTRIRTHTNHTVTIYLMDNCYFRLSVDSQTRVCELHDYICQRMNLNSVEKDWFGLFVMQSSSFESIRLAFRSLLLTSGMEFDLVRRIMDLNKCLF